MTKQRSEILFMLASCKISQIIQTSKNLTLAISDGPFKISKIEFLRKAVYRYTKILKRDYVLTVIYDLRLRLRLLFILSKFATLFFFSVPSLNAQLYWNKNGVSGNWTNSNWGTSSAGPFTTAYKDGNNAFFTSNSTLFFGSTTVGNMTISAGANVTILQSGTLTNPISNLVTSYDIGNNATLSWANQSVASNAGFIKNGNGTWNRGNGGINKSTGGFTLNAGTVSVTGPNGFGAGNLTINGGTISSSGNITFSVLTNGHFEKF